MSAAANTFYILSTVAIPSDTSLLLDNKSILLIEWPESVSEGLPEPDLTIKIEVEGFSRRIQIDKNVVE